MPLKEYNSNEIESKWYKEWLEKNIFFADYSDDRESFSIVMPPPNVTGSLHIGHALNMTLQDIFIRYKRMKNFNVLWLPGFDHAGIATQWVVTRQLEEKGINKFDLGREKFIQEVWKWVPKARDTIKKQVERLGASCDWTKQRFTLDEGFARAVRTAFSNLYKEGLIFKAPYIVNWDPKDRTAISDLEVEYQEENGNLWYIKYPVVNENGKETGEYITVATTRPETMLGDTAVAVNPSDERYKNLIGKYIKLPLAPEIRISWDGKEVSNIIPIIADDYVDPEYGTGAVKITPAHDPNDFEVGKRHNLPMVVVMDESAVMNDNAGKYKGLERYEARKKIVEDLKELGLLEKIENIVHKVGHSQRSGAVVEPYLSVQWFVDTKKLADAAIKAVEKEDIKFIPKQWEKTYLNWMYEIKEWCISRQIWWGHRIPVWYCQKCNEINVFNDDDFDSVEHKTIFNIYGDTRISQFFSYEELKNYLFSENFTQKDKTNLEFYEKVVFRQNIEGLKEENLKEFLEENFKKVPVLNSENEEHFIGFPPHAIFYLYINNLIPKSFTAEDLLKSYKKHETQLKEIFTLFLNGIKKEEVFENPDTLKNWLIDHSYGNCPNGKIFFSEVDGVFSIIEDNIKEIRYFIELECKKCGSKLLKQEEDVLDTWFSSALWPFGTLGWPQKTPELEKYYPTSLLVTGFDIIFFWVARMIMMGLHFTKEKPFSDVYIHALVRDEKGEKMSKTKGNVIDPLDMIEKYGADSLRFTLAALAAQGRDIRLSEKRIEGYRNFANKIWNASKYVLQNAENFEGKIINDVKDLDLSYEDKWIISKLQKTIQKAEDALTSYRYNDYANIIYDFFWHDYCDWYLEFTKERVYKGTDEDKQVALSTLIYVLDASLKLLHPVMPFITEEIWQYIPGKKENYLSLAKYPDVQNDLIFEEEENLIENIKELVVAIRAARAEFGIQPSQKINIYIKPENEKVEEILKLLKNPLSNLIRAQNLEISTNLSGIDNMATAISSIGQAFIDVAGAIDVQKEIERQEKLLSETEKYISIIEKKLSNENFLKKAPKDVVEKEKSLYEEQKERKAKILTIIENLKKLIS